MLTIKVLGPGCANCDKVAAAAQAAVNSLGVQADIRKITDFQEIRKYKVLSTPGLVINEELVAAGRIPSEGEITTWVVNAHARA